MRFVPPGGWYSVEFPATPECGADEGMRDCRYVDPANGRVFRTRHWKIRLLSDEALRKDPSRNLKGLVLNTARSEGLEVLLNNATTADGFAAIDYRLGAQSNSPSTVQAAGQFINLGEKVIQIVHLSVDGREAIPEDVIQRFVKSFRAENGGQGLAPLPPSIASLFQGSMVKPGVFTYQRITETAVWEQVADREPLNYSTQTTRRTIQRKRDKKRDALIVTVSGRTLTGTFEERTWLDAKTLIPYKQVSRSSRFDAMLAKQQTSTFQLENINGVWRGESTGPFKGKFEHPVGDTPLLLAGAALELAVSSLPLEEGFIGSIRVFEPDGFITQEFHSDWRVLVMYAPDLVEIAGMQADKKGLIKTFKVELTEHKAKSPRKLTLWIENSPARRILQVETFVPDRQHARTSVNMLQTKQ
ncbi:hypothetical protein NR798_32470 [Archangium gephyra]|uniref:hypothetical protein n=1 Tax=Archangium gephyra TaxID=48 RepID=UPI0035D423D0